MSIFHDKHYAQLDWVSQAVQPIETPINAILEKLPAEMRIDYEMVTSYSPQGEVTIDVAVYHMRNKWANTSVTWREQMLIDDCFAFDLRSEELILNLEDHTLTGELYVVKTKFTVDEDLLQRTLGEHGRDELGRMDLYSLDIPRMNEMLELLEGCEDSLGSRSTRVKKNAMVSRLRKILMDNEWRIRSTELANKIGIWMKKYIETGDLAALSNITRVKVMTYKEGPIYSIEEVPCH